MGMALDTFRDGYHRGITPELQSLIKRSVHGPDQLIPGRRPRVARNARAFLPLLRELSLQFECLISSQKSRFTFAHVKAVQDFIAQRLDTDPLRNTAPNNIGQLEKPLIVQGLNQIKILLDKALDQLRPPARRADELNTQGRLCLKSERGCCAFVRRFGHLGQGLFCLCDRVRVRIEHTEPRKGHRDIIRHRVKTNTSFKSSCTSPRPELGQDQLVKEIIDRGQPAREL
jgi:hypothetical protein